MCFMVGQGGEDPAGEADLETMARILMTTNAAVSIETVNAPRGVAKARSTKTAADVDSRKADPVSDSGTADVPYLRTLLRRIDRTF